jgi:hypothetical protein
MRPLFPSHQNKVPARSPFGITHLATTGKNSCRLPARIVDVDQNGYENGINPAHIAPRKPPENGTDESFNGRLRDECLTQEWFRNRREARAIIEHWRQHYNHVRPHSSLDYMTPNEFRATSIPTRFGEAVLQ